MAETNKRSETLPHWEEDSVQSQAEDHFLPPEEDKPFVERLAPSDRAALTAKGRTEFFAAGSVICREGDPGNELYILQEGRVAVLKEVSSGRPVLLSIRGRGEILGEMSLVGEQPRSASLIAVEKTQLLRITADRFRVLMNEYPGISWNVLLVLNDRLHEADIARTVILKEEQDLAQRLERLTSEAERLAELARVRQETIELVAHDLRTPLTVIDGCIQMLELSLSEEALASAGKILSLAQRSASRLMTLLEELLAAARQEVTYASLARQPVNLSQMLADCLESVRAKAKEVELDLVLALPPTLPCPSGDPTQLRRVLDNLIENAISYTPEGGQITLGASATEEQVAVSITDTGPGVPLEYREVIFERFTRVPGVQGRKQGFGLGLYFCRQVIEAHGGQIWVEPGPKEVGSRFVFTLSRAAHPDEAPTICTEGVEGEDEHE
jgi:signal transduction histidine kinase